VFIVLTLLALIAALVLAVIVTASRMAPAEKRTDLDVEAGSGRPPGRSGLDAEVVRCPARDRTAPATASADRAAPVCHRPIERPPEACVQRRPRCERSSGDGPSLVGG
jgi:hypothetical protein